MGVIKKATPIELSRIFEYSEVWCLTFSSNDNFNPKEINIPAKKPKNKYRIPNIIKSVLIPNKIKMMNKENRLITEAFFNELIDK